MTEAEAVAAAKREYRGDRKLLSTAIRIGPDCPDIYLREKYAGYWHVGFEDSDSFYMVNAETEEVRFILCFCD